MNKTYKEAYSNFTRSGNNSSDFYEFCNGRKDVYYLRLLLHDKPQLHETVKAGVPDSCALTSNEEIPSATPTPRKTKDSGYDSVVTSLNSLADREGKKRKMEILIREDARKQKEEERKDREEERKIRAEQREEKDYAMKEKDYAMNEFEKITDLLRKNRQDLSDPTLSLDEREDLLCTQQLLMSQKKKLQQTLFSTNY